MTASRVLLELVLVLGVAALVTVAFQALRVPVVLGYVVAGMLIGPHVPVPLIANADLVHVLSELGVILLMFTIGLELRLSAIARLGLRTALAAVFEVGLAIAIGTLVANLLGLPMITAVFAGACLGISSTMLVAKTFEERGWKGGFTEIVFAILVFEDLIAIGLLAVLTGVVGGKGLDGADVAMMLAKLVGFLVLTLVAGLLIVPRAIRAIHARARPETVVISALAICFGASALASGAGYSVALGAFLGGILIAESGRGREVLELVKPFRDVFAMVFFVSVGMTIDPASLLAEAPRIAVFTAVVLLVKPIGVAIGVFLGGHGITPAVRSGLSLAQIGELSFVIAAIAPASDVDLLAITVGIACLTMLTSAVTIRNGETIASWLAARLPRHVATFVSFYEAWLGRLRDRDGVSAWRRYRRTIVVVVLDAGVIVVVAIAASTFGVRVLADYVALSGLAAGIVLVAASATLCAPFVVSLMRRVAVISRRLAAEVIPIANTTNLEPSSDRDAAIDLGRAPRRALIVTFELALALAITIPIVALIQPFVPASPVIVPLVVLVLLAVLRRSIADFEGHVRAGSELVVEVLARAATFEADRNAGPLAQIETILPGFGGLQSIVVGADSPAVGRSLAELDLRVRTGATVLAIGRGEHGVASPSPTEPLCIGDVLALTGSVDAIAAARALLGAHRQGDGGNT